jgi:hypothetical protein
MRTPDRGDERGGRVWYMVFGVKIHSACAWSKDVVSSGEKCFWSPVRLAQHDAPLRGVRCQNLIQGVIRWFAGWARWLVDTR